MKKLEYKIVIVYLPSEKEEEENERLRDLGLPIKESSNKRDERFVKYSFRPSRIVGYRETFVNYKEGELSGVIACYETDGFSYETPVLLVSYEQFEKDIEEYEQFNKEESEVE